MENKNTDQTCCEMERARKKSSKQMLEEKQMKRYFRSKKRSQIKDKVEDEEKVDETPGRKKQVKENANNGKEEVKGLYKEETKLTNNVKSYKETKIRKENTMVKKDDSSEPEPEKARQILKDDANNRGSENKICAMNEKESIIKVLKSKPSDSSIEKAEQIMSKMTEKNMEEKEKMESTTKETNTRSQHKAIDKITKTDVQKEKNSKIILDQINRDEGLVDIESKKNNYKICAEDQMTKSVTVSVCEDIPMIANILDLIRMQL